MGKDIWKPGTVIYPVPAVMVSCGMGVLYLLFLFLLGCLDKRMLSLLLGKKTGGR